MTRKRPRIAEPRPVTAGRLPRGMPVKARRAWIFEPLDRWASNIEVRLAAARWCVDVGLAPGYIPQSASPRAPTPIYFPKHSEAGRPWGLLNPRLRKQLPGVIVTTGRRQGAAWVVMQSRVLDDVLDLDADRLGSPGRDCLMRLDWTVDQDKWRAWVHGRYEQAAAKCMHAGLLVVDDRVAYLTVEGTATVRAIVNRRLAQRHRWLSWIQDDDDPRCHMCAKKTSWPGRWCRGCASWMIEHQGALRVAGVRQGRWHVEDVRDRLGCTQVELEHPGNYILQRPWVSIDPVCRQARMVDAMLRAR